MLMLRPTESATVFLQQLGRGLRWAEGKRVLTVLDLVGQVRREYRYDIRYRALLGGTRHQVQRAVEADFPLLPPGCALELDRIAKETVLRNLRDSVRNARARLADDLRTLGPGARLGVFMHQAGAELEDIYAKPHSGRCFVELRRRAGFSDGAAAYAPRDPLLRAVGRLLHVDDHERLAAWRAILESGGPDPNSSLRGREHRLGLMLFAILGGRRQSTSQADRILQGIRESVELRQEINDLLDILDDRIRTVAQPFDEAADVPLASHATYSLGEIAAAHGRISTNAAHLSCRRPESFGTRPRRRTCCSSRWRSRTRTSPRRRAMPTIRFLRRCFTGSPGTARRPTLPPDVAMSSNLRVVRTSFFSFASERGTAGA